MSITYSTALLGLGRVAAFYGKPSDPRSYCHAAGIMTSPRVRLAAVADPMTAARERFSAEWSAALGQFSSHQSFAELWRTKPVDIVTICVRGPEHFPMMQEVIAAGPRHILLEKPPTCSLAEADALVAAAAAKGIPITVSYSRHWAPVNLRLQELIRGGLIGRVHTIIAYADTAVLSAAVHGFDAMCQFVGYDPVAVTAHGVPGNETRSGYEPEPIMQSAVVEFASGITGLISGQRGEHGVFYVDILGTDGHARVGMYTSPVVTVKDRRVPIEELGLPVDASPFKGAYDQIAASLDGGPVPHCTGADWQRVNELGFGAAESILTRQRVVLPTTNRARRIFANG